MALVTRQPTRRTGWPRVLISGNDKSGKSWSVAEFSKSAKIGRTVVLVLGEDESRWDEYGNIGGARFELAVWDGTWRSLMETAEDAKEDAAKAVANGEPPFVLCVDTMTAVWESLKDWASDRARGSKKNKKLLEEDPDAEIDVTSNYWNDAKARHRGLMRVLLTFPGIVVLICRGSEVTLFQNGQPVANRTTWSVECEKNLPFDVSAHVQLSRDARPKLVSASGVHVQIRPGIDPAERLPSDWSLEWLLFDRFKLDPANAAAGGFTVMQADVTPEAIRDEAVKDETTVARLQDLYRLARRLRYDSVTLPNERGAEELLPDMIARIGKDRQRKAAQAEQAAAAFKLDPDDPWLEAIHGVMTTGDDDPIRADLIETFKGKPEAAPRVRALLAALDARMTEISAPQAVAA